MKSPGRMRDKQVSLATRPPNVMKLPSRKTIIKKKKKHTVFKHGHE